MVCRNICERIYSKIVVGELHYSVGKKYCRRCECYFITKKIFCECCGMQLRTTPIDAKDKSTDKRKDTKTLDSLINESVPRRKYSYKGNRILERICRKPQVRGG
jgi:hypothetical protein